MQTNALEGGFLNAPTDSAFAFRAAMTAMARPGEIFQVKAALPPAPMSIAAGVLLLTLCDAETPVFLAASHNTPALIDWITFHTGAPIVDAAQAQFAVGKWADLTLAEFAIGTAEYPDRSATLIVEMEELANAGATLRGPGIEHSNTLNLPETAAFQRNGQHFPCGLDFLFACQDRLAALPRTTRVI
jgi:alpha-D-ribose 1-methylphosphonate 5-triphosphate synthase subunit PhnH